MAGRVVDLTGSTARGVTVAHRADTDVGVTVRLDGSLNAVASANARSAVEITVSLATVDGGTATVIDDRTVLDEEVASALQGAVTRSFEDSPRVGFDFQAEVGRTYRLELRARCESSASFTLSFNQCAFGTDAINAGVFWSDAIVVFDEVVCDPPRDEPGCFDPPPITTG